MKIPSISRMNEGLYKALGLKRRDFNSRLKTSNGDVGLR